MHQILLLSLYPTDSPARLRQGYIEGIHRVYTGYIQGVYGVCKGYIHGIHRVYGGNAEALDEVDNDFLYDLGLTLA